MADKIIEIIDQSKFGDKAKQAARLRLIEHKPYAEIVSITGINRERIRQIEAVIKRRVKEKQ